MVWWVVVDVVDFFGVVDGFWWCGVVGGVVGNGDWVCVVCGWVYCVGCGVFFVVVWVDLFVLYEELGIGVFGIGDVDVYWWSGVCICIVGVWRVE